MTYKVLYVNATKDQYAGGERRLVTLAEAARDSGFDVYVACNNESELQRVLRSTTLNVRPILLRNNLFNDFREIRKILMQIKPDIIHTTGFWINNISRLAGRSVSTPIIISNVLCEPDSTLQFKSGFIWKINQFTRNTFDRSTSRFASRVIAVSERVKKKLILYGISADKISYIPDGASPELIERLSKIGTSMDLPKTKLIGCIGRLEEVKGFKFFIDALEILLKDRVLTAFIVGEGPLASELKAYAKKRKVSDSIFFTGWLDYGDLLGLLSRIDVYVVPSLSEGLNTTLLEALILERPVVASSVGGIPEVIVNGKTGLLVPPKEPIAISNAVKTLLDDDLTAEHMGHAGRKLVLDKYTMDQMIGRTLNLYQELLDDKSVKKRPNPKGKKAEVRKKRAEIRDRQRKE